MSNQRTRKFVTQIIRKTCSSLVKIISDGDNNFTKNKYNKLQKISAKNVCFAKNKCKSANMGSSTVQLYGTCRPDRYSNSKLIIKTYFILYKTHVTIL